MICPSCHHDNIEGADECANCGASLYGLDLPGQPQGSQSPDFIHQPIARVSYREPVKVGLRDPVSLAVREMRRTDTNSVLVMEGDRVEGIITGWDIVQKVAGPTEDLTAVTCSQIMTAQPTVLHQEDTVAVALNLMAAGGFRHVPIVAADGTPLGVVVSSDLFRHVSPQLV